MGIQQINFLKIERFGAEVNLNCLHLECWEYVLCQENAFHRLHDRGNEEGDKTIVEREAFVKMIANKKT